MRTRCEWRTWGVPWCPLGRGVRYVPTEPSPMSIPTTRSTFLLGVCRLTDFPRCVELPTCVSGRRPVVRCPDKVESPCSLEFPGSEGSSSAAGPESSSTSGPSSEPSPVGDLPLSSSQSTIVSWYVVWAYEVRISIPSIHCSTHVASLLRWPWRMLLIQPSISSTLSLMAGIWLVLLLVAFAYFKRTRFSSRMASVSRLMFS